MGMLLLPLGALVIGLYLWGAVKVTRWAFRRYAASRGIAAIAMLALFPTWDTIVNHAYHKYVLCTRSDVGLHTYARVTLPSKYYDSNGRLIEPDGWFGGRTFLVDRYQRQSGFSEGGIFPITSYEKRFSAIYDRQENRQISYESDYWTKGGGWWLIIFRPLLSQEDYSRYVRGIIDGVTCAVEKRDGMSQMASVNVVFELK